MEETPLKKRAKLQINTEMKIKSILPTEYEKEIALVEAYCSKINDKRSISTIMQELGKLLPLSSLSHLKRVRQNEILICKVADVQSATLEEYLKKQQLNMEVIELLSAAAEIRKVPADGCKLRWQYEAMQSYWPCKFHPDKYFESLYKGNNFTEEQYSFHKKIAKLTIKLSSMLEAGKPTGICIDPRSNSIVAIAGSKCDINPVMHCPMTLIDFVARSQNAGAWHELNQKDTFIKDDASENVTLAGIAKCYYEFLNNEEASENLKFGAERLQVNVKVDLTTSQANSTSDNLTKYGPYLCTGYDVYLSQEPCLMCAMALVHSRVKRIFFVQSSRENGALLSCFKLQNIKELNHHYEVFQCIELPMEQCIDS